MKKRILFLSTHNLATNPRLVKEVELALQNDFKVTAVCFEFDNWSKILNEELKKRFQTKITYFGIPGKRNPFLPWLFSSLVFSFSKILLNFFPENIYLLSLASNKRSWLLLKKLKKIQGTFDLAIAHNPGSFYPAYIFAKKNKIPFGIDLEDYHPGETKDKTAIKYAKNLNKEILPKADYITAASPLILEYSEADLDMPLKNKQVILNYFSAKEFIEPSVSSSESLRLVWFSQNISFNRGLEQLIEVIKDNQQIGVHLYGNCDLAFREQWIDGHENITLHASVSQMELHRRLSDYDVGLAIEPGRDLNNELALSNKMLAYFQAGLFILASKTKAQERFIIEHPKHGVLSSLSNNDLKEALEKLIREKQSIRLLSKKNFEHAKRFNWENESEGLAETWKILHTGQTALSGPADN